jgi:hypothetical protein
MKVSSFFQFIFGFLIGICGFAGMFAVFGYILFLQMTKSPPRPQFAEEKTKPAKVVNKDKATPAKDALNKKTVKPAVDNKNTDKSKAEETQVIEEEKLPAGAYKGRITWSQGISLRDNPTNNSNRVGGVEYNGNVIVLKQSDDKAWLLVRVPNSSVEGWTKAGNVGKQE